jgi:hypothetical protein
VEKHTVPTATIKSVKIAATGKESTKERISKAMIGNPKARL